MTLDRLYRDVENLKQHYKGLAGGPQLALSSIENGAIDSNDADGNLKMTIGEQDDGGNTINVLNGPTPPTPVGFTVDVDHGCFILHWQGGFDGDALAPSDWSRAEVHASQDPFFVPSRATARGSIVSAASGEVTIGVLKGPWTVKMVAWSQAGKMSVPSQPVDVEVPGYGDIVLEEIDAANTEIKNGNSILVNAQDTLGGKLDSAFGQIADFNDDLSDLGDAVEGAIASANGKNRVHFDDRAPTPADPGIAGDPWFVGQVGRPNDVVEATNYATNPSLEASAADWSPYSWTGTGARMQGQGAIGDWFYRLTASATLTGAKGRYHDVPAPVISGEVWTLSIHVRPSRTITMQAQGEFRNSSGVVGPVAQAGPSISCPANQWTRVHLTMTATGDATVVRFQNYLRSATLQAGDTLDLDGEVITLGQLSPFFDGDTPSGTTDNESHYRWTGTPHASTSEKYLPATDGLSDKWNVTEQYRYDGTGWVQVELSHSVISSVDVGALTAGSAAIKEAVVQKLFAEVVVARMSVADEFIGENAILTGAVTAPKITASEELWAKIANFVNVKAEMMDADVFIGRRFEGVDISASRFTAGFAVEITESYGIRQFGPDGALNVSLPSDGSTAWISADIKAKSLTVAGPMSIEGLGKVASGGLLQLESGVTPPAAPPNVSTYVKRTQFPPLAETESAVGLAFDGTYFWRAVDNSVTGESDRMERIDTAGNLVSSFEHMFWVRNGITIIGTEIFALGIEEGSLRDKSKRFIYVYDFTGNLKRKWEYAAYGSGTYQPAIGTDGTDVFVTQCWAEGHASWRRYNKTTGVGTGRYDSDFGLKSDIVSADIGSFDYGSPTMVITKAVERGAVEIYNPTTGEHPNWGGWFSGDIEPVRGTAWATGRFHHLTTAGNLVTMSTTKHPNGSVGPDTNDWWAVYTWRNGANETTISAPQQFTWMRRGGIKLSPGQMPAGVSSVRVYVARKATEPARTDYKLVATTVADGSQVVQDLGTPSGNPPASNSFPNSSPGIIRSALGNLEFRGDGSGRIGPLTFNADGTMSSSAVPDWVPVTSFATGYGPQTWGFAPAYRVWPDEKVEWRGVVRVSGTPPEANDMRLGTADVFTVPVAARPTHAVNITAASTSGTNMRRVEFSSADAPTMFRVYHSKSGGAWVSLEGIYYYRS